VLAILLLLGLVASFVPAARWWVIGTVRGEAFFEHRPTSYWAQQLDDWIYQEEARKTLIAGGEKAAPVLLQMLGWKDRPCPTHLVTDILIDAHLVRTVKPQLLEIIRDRDNPNRDWLWHVVLNVDPKAADEAMFGANP
jgi:hypothetical protein